MSKYQLKPGVDMAFLPNVGKVVKGREYMGESYSKFVGGLLVEVPDVPAQKPLESTESPSGPAPLTEPAPAPAPVRPSEEVTIEKGSKIILEDSGAVKLESTTSIKLEGEKKGGRSKGSAKSGG